MTDMKGASSKERDDGIATSLPEVGDGVEEDILEQEIPLFLSYWWQKENSPTYPSHSQTEKGKEYNYYHHYSSQAISQGTSVGCPTDRLKTDKPQIKIGYW